MRKKKPKLQDWIFRILFVILIAPYALFLSIYFYSKAHPGGDIPVSEPEQFDTLQYDLDEYGQRERIDSSLVLESVESDVSGFSRWRGARTVVFFFSAACSHCKKAFPIFQALADSLSQEGVQVVVLAVAGNSHAGIQDFARDRQSHLPMYHDEDRRFGMRYGFGSVPSVLLVDDSGNYMRHSGFHSSTPGLIRTGLKRMGAAHIHGDSIGS